MNGIYRVTEIRGTEVFADAIVNVSMAAAEASRNALQRESLRRGKLMHDVRYAVRPMPAVTV